MRSSPRWARRAGRAQPFLSIHAPRARGARPHQGPRADRSSSWRGASRRRVRVLCLDEFFVADIADAMILAGALEGLFRRGVTSVATSNVPPQDLYKDGLQRQRFLPAIALIECACDVLHVDSGVDYRLRQLERAPTYLDSGLAADAARPACSVSRRSPAARATAPATLTIEGRPTARRRRRSRHRLVRVRRALRRSAQPERLHRARPALRHPVHRERPRIHASDEDAARRFIMLIDELYDRGVKIVVSAAAPPATLYRGERLRFEFQRAASRLVEMQTQQYLAGRAPCLKAPRRPGIIRRCRRWPNSK